jgi:SAM-dependent methyltransferase
MTGVPPIEDPHWFNPIAAHLGKAYWAPDTGRVMAFTKGTEQEVSFLWEALQLQDGQRVLDVGCGPGRHSLALARRGVEVVGIDLSPDFVVLATESAAREGLSASFEVADVRALAFDGVFDAVICLCQGGFGLLGGREEVPVFERIVRSVCAGGGVAVSAFHTAFVVRHLEPGETFDPATGVLHEHATARNEEGEERTFDLWTTCFTARELELLGSMTALEGVVVHGVAPGRYRAAPPDLDAPELLLLGRAADPAVTGRNANM